jgi:hypothetical protein
MKKFIETDNSTAEEQGFTQLIGEKVTVFACRYIYTGKLIEEGEGFIKLEDPSIAYETGSFSDKKFSDKQSLCVNSWNISKASIESFGVLNKG